MPDRSNTTKQLAADSEPARVAGQVLAEAIRNNRRFWDAVWPKTVLAPLVSRYLPGMSYGEHLDNPVMGQSPRVRTDIAMTVFLNGPEEYDGGELLIDTGFGTCTCKGSAGDAVVYSADFLHRVEPITRGQRLVVVTWIQSLVRDPLQRQILYELSGLARRLSGEFPERTDGRTIEQCHNSLVRMWAEL